MSFLTEPFNDTFTRTESGDWGTSDSSHTWNTPVTFSVDGSRGVLNIPSYNSAQLALVDGSDEADVDMVASFTLPDDPSGDSLNLDLMSRYASSNGTYGRISINPDGTTSTYIQNTGSSTSATAGGSWTGQTIVHIHFKIVGTSARIKVWFGEDEEPTNWTLSKTITSTNATGQVGIRATLGASSTNTLPYDVLVDDAVFTAAAPGTSLIDAFTRSVSNGFGSSDSDHTYSLAAGSATKLSVNGSRGAFSLTDDNIAVAVTADVTVSDYRIEFDAGTVGAQTDNMFVGAVTRWTDASNYIWTYLTLSSTNTATLTVRKTVAGVSTTIGTVSLGSFTPGTFYSVAAEIIGTKVVAKAWLTTSSEPASWSIDATDTSLPAPGIVGFRATRGTTGATGTSYVDNINIRDVTPGISVTLVEDPDSPGVRVELANGDVYHAVRVSRVHVENQIASDTVRGLDVVNIPSAIASAVDYEVPLDEAFIYEVVALDSELNVISKNESEPITVEVPYHRVILKSIGLPTLSSRIQITAFPEFNQDLRVLQEAKVLGRSRSVVLFDVMEGITGSFSFMTLLDQDPIGLGIRDLVNGGQPLLFQSVSRVSGLPDFYFVVKSLKAVRKTTIHPTESPRYIYTVEFQEVHRPPTDSETLGFFSWETPIDAGHESWQSVDDTFTNWLAVLNFANRTPL